MVLIPREKVRRRPLIPATDCDSSPGLADSRYVAKERIDITCAVGNQLKPPTPFCIAVDFYAIARSSPSRIIVHPDSVWLAHSGSTPS